MSLNKYDFDAYYAICCSRGPGTETLTLQKLHSYDEWKMARGASAELAKYGVASAEADWADEGPILCVPVGTFPLPSIYRWVLFDALEFSLSDIEPELKKQIIEAPNPFKLIPWIPANEQAFLSALLRVWLQPLPVPTELDDTVWTSTNGWREVSIEVMNRPQFETFVNTMGIDYDDIAKWNCAVIQRTLELARKGNLPEKPYRGC